jgi:hypothetical protein
VVAFWVQWKRCTKEAKSEKNPCVYEMLKLQEIPIIGVNTFLIQRFSNGYSAEVIRAEEKTNIK